MPNSKYIDNDLTEVPEDQGAGKLDTDDQALMAAEYRGPEFEMVPRAQWRDKINAMETILRGITPKTKNQGRNGSCVGHGCVSALEFRGRFQYGHKFTQMSAQSVYCRIGRSASSGAYIPNGIDCMVEDGALPDLTESETWDVTMDSTKWPGRDRLPSGWRDVAEEFKVTACRIQGADQFASAAFNGCPVVYGRQGHCIYIFGVTYDRGNYYWMYQNSWGSWGDEVRDGMRGLGYDSERIIRNCTGYAITGVKRNKTIALPELKG